MGSEYLRPYPTVTKYMEALALEFDEFGRFHPRGLRVDRGEWVADRTTYDVTIVDEDGVRLAVVGFTEGNSTGALFAQWDHQVRTHSRRVFQFTGDTMDRIRELAAQQYTTRDDDNPQESASGFHLLNLVF